MCGCILMVEWFFVVRNGQMGVAVIVIMHKISIIVNIIVLTYKTKNKTSKDSGSYLCDLMYIKNYLCNYPGHII